MKTTKYIVDYVSKIATRIARETDIDGYTEGIIEIFFPDEDEIDKWTDEQTDEWIRANNNRMEAICKFLNENNL